MRKLSLFLATALSLAFAPALARADPCDDPGDDCREHENYAVPGGHAALYAPVTGGQPYVGGGFSLTLAQWSHDNDSYGPGRGSVFFQASLLRSPASEHTLGIYEGGAALSFERNPNRRYLIPYFGFTTGAMVQESWGDEGFIQPMVGLQIVSHPNVSVDVNGGYVFPFGKVDELQGVRAQASVRFHAW